MNTELLNNVSNYFKPAAETFRALNRLNVATIEKVVGIELANIQANAELTVANLKAGIEVSDADGAKAYAKRQNEVAKTAYERFVADSKALGGIAKDYSEEAIKLVKQTAPASTPVEAPVSSPKAKKSA